MAFLIGVLVNFRIICEDKKDDIVSAIEASIFLKRCVLFFIFLCSANFLNAQDTIVRINGEKIPAKIIEIAPTYILYKPFTAPDSVNVMISTDEVFRILYANGERDVLNDPKISGEKYKITWHDRQYFYQHLPPDRTALYRILKSQNDHEINMYVKKSKKYKTMSTFFAWSGIPVFLTINYGSSIISVQNSENNNRFIGYTLFLMASSVISVETTAIIMNVLHKKNMIRAVNRYNRNIFE